MRRISILGIVLGGMVAVFVTVIFGMGMGVYAAFKLNIAHETSPAHAQALVQNFVYRNPLVYFSTMAVATASTVFGGWLSAFTAREGERLNGALAGLGLAGIHVWRCMHNEDPHSVAVQVVYVAALLAGGWTGGWLRARQKAKVGSAPLARV